MPIQIRSSLSSLVPYKPGKPASVGRSGEDPLKLASNENAFGVSPKVRRVITQTAHRAHIYPAMYHASLLTQLADYHYVDPGQVVLGNGSDELIVSAAQVVVEPGTEVILSTKTFPTYLTATHLMGGTPVFVELKDGHYDLPGMLARVTESTRLVYLCNPNNPTGTIFTEEKLAWFLGELPDRILVVIDEAYYEYVESPEFPKSLEWVAKKDNIVVLRTFSKAYGLAGLRIGYGIGQPSVMEWFDRVRLPFCVNQVAAEAASVALSDHAFLTKVRENNRKEKPKLVEGITKLGLTALPSEANFICFDVPFAADDLVRVLEEERGITIRALTSLNMPHSVRVTIGTPRQNSRFLEALKQAKETFSAVPVSLSKEERE